MSDHSAAPASRPALTVVRGDATAAEVAALVVALAARAGQRAVVPRAPAAQWAARDRMMRPAVAAGPGAWRSSTLPR